MKQFAYRLEPLLKLRKHTEREKQREYSHAMQKVNEQEQQLGGIDRAHERSCNNQRERLVGKLSVGQLLSFSRYLVKLKGDRLSGTELLRGLNINADEKRQGLVSAARERKKYEKLKEKMKERFDENIQRETALEEEEIATTIFRRNQTK